MAGEGGLAEQIRTGLDEQFVGQLEIEEQVDPLDELWFRKPIRQHIKEFGCVLAIILVVVAAISAKRGSFELALVWAISAFVITVVAYHYPSLLKPVWKGAMALGHYLGMIVTFAILSATWTIVLLPIAALLKILRVRVMNMKFKEPVDSYWERRDPATCDFKFLERQF